MMVEIDVADQHQDGRFVDIRLSADMPVADLPEKHADAGIAADLVLHGSSDVVTNTTFCDE